MKLPTLLAVGLLASILIACDSSSDNDQSATTQTRFVNLVTDSEDITFEVDEVVQANSIDFRRASVFSNVSGIVEIDVELLDGDDTAATIINDQQVTLDGEINYTLFATGTSANASLFVTQRSRDEPDMDFTRMQFINATDQSLTISMLPSLNPTDAAYSTTLSSLSADTADDYLSQSVIFRVLDNNNSVLLETTSYSPESEDTISIVVTDYVGPANSEASVDLLVVDAGAETTELTGDTVNASIRFANAVTNVASAYIRLIDSSIMVAASTIPYSQASGRENIEAGLFEVELADSVSPETSLFNSNVSLLGGFDFTYLLSGDINAPEGILVIDELCEVATHAQLNLVHASASLGDVDIYISSDISDPLSGTNLLDLSYRSQRSTNVDGGAYSITATSQGGNAIVAGPFLLQLEDGDIIDMILREDESSGAPFSFSQF